MESPMRITPIMLTLALALGFVGTSALRGQEAAPANPSVVPPLIKFNGVIPSATTQNRTANSASTGLVTATFSLYEFHDGGTPLWSESQKIQLDEQGRYVVLLGATSSAGLPLDLFTSGKALWLGVQPQLSAAGELPRVLLVAVPYALKASDSDTLGGKPASAYALAGAPTVVGLAGVAGLPATNLPQPGNKADAAAGNAASVPPVTPCAAVTSSGSATADAIAKFSTTCNIENSLLRDNGTGVAVGGTATPGALLDVQFTSTATSGTLLGARLLTTLNPAASSAASTSGLFSNALTSSGNAQTITGSIFALNSEVDHYGTGSLGFAYGTKGAVYNRAAGTISSAYGINAALSNLSTGKISNGYGVYVAAPANFGGGTFSNYTGVYIANPSAVTGAYGLYSAGGKNFFAGNVGIGTTTPAANLEVNGTTKFDGPVTFAAAQTFTGVGSGLTSVNAAELGGLLPSAFQPAGFYATLGANTFAGRQTISSGGLSVSNGNVGIGTSAPAAELNLNQGNTQNQDTLLIGNNSTRGLLLRDTGLGMDIETYGVGLFLNNNTGQDIILNANASGNGGRVGVGTNSPAGLLDVEGGTAPSGNGIVGLKVVAQTGATTTNSGGYGESGGGSSSQPAAVATGLTGGAGGAVVITGGKSGKFTGDFPSSIPGGSVTIQGGQSPTGANPGSIILAASGGLVGIGTSTPDASLNLNQGNAQSKDTLLIGNNSTKGLQLRDTGTGLDIESFGLGLFVNNTTGQDTLLNGGGGRVGIGTNAPAHTLDVHGDIHASGAITGSSKNFRIDHPLDPEHKYLYHASIESSEMKNMYDGVARLDSHGEAEVNLPEWFEALNQDFRYQLTAVEAPGPNLYIKEKIQSNRFRIAGGQPDAEVSWQVTGVRHDAWAKEHPLQVEQEKPPQELPQ